MLRRLLMPVQVMNRLLLCGWLTASGLFLTSGVVHGQTSASTQLPAFPVDSLVKWWDLLGVSPADFESYRIGGDMNLRFVKQDVKDQVLWTLQGSKATRSYLLSLFGGRFIADNMNAFFSNGTLSSLVVYFTPLPNDESVQKGLKEQVEKLLGMPPDESPHMQFKENNSGTPFAQARWEISNAYVTVYETKNNRGVLWIRPSGAPAGMSTASESSPPSRQLMADLDGLLNFPDFWKCTPAQFEALYSPKITADGQQERPPQFEWLSAAKDRARFSRKMFPNAETKLTMFGGSIKVEEAVVEFANGRAVRTILSLYNRGDSGQMGTPEFETLYRKIGKSLGQVMKVVPKSQLNSSNAALRTTGWNWTSPLGIALLEFNDYNSRDATGRQLFPEFLRLKLASPDQMDWSMGRLSVGVGKMLLSKNVTKTGSGDTYIANIPMVDQGAKGYCVAASCQRLFEYLQIPCDQHEMAQLVGVDADGGVDSRIMQKSLAKIDGRFNVVFKAHINPENYYDSKRKRRVSEREFALTVKEYVDKGTPLLWALNLGEYTEDPPLPGDGQVRGGHMRMIIGYNSSKNQLLFTDSWGAGHELKRMDASDAYNCTIGMYSMLPRGL